MISVGSRLYISDNSGAVTATCIKVPGNSTRMKGKPGNVIIVTLNKVKSNKKITPHQIKKALLVGTVYPFRKANGVSIRFSKNSAILLDDRGAPLSNRVKQHVLSDLRAKHYMKIISISFGIL